jgi:hypothetical protein
VPDGPTFSIVGQRYRFWGHTHLEISKRFREPWRVADAGSESTWDDSHLLAEAITVAAGCQVRPFTVLYGLLSRSDDVVFARVAGRMTRLDRVGLPASLHTQGVLVYGATSRAPSEFTVRTRAGRLIRLNEVGWSRSVPAGCGHQERLWVQKHFSHTEATAALTEIADCLRREGFELGAPDESGFGFLRLAKWRLFDAARSTCRIRAQRAAAVT